MSFVAAAVVGAGVIGAAASYAGSQAQAGAAEAGTAAQLGMFQSIQSNMQPYLSQGDSSIQQLGGYMNASETGGPGGVPGLLHTFNAQDLNANLAPNYQFQLGQGQGMLANQNAAAGGAGGGNAFAGEEAYTQNTAASAYQNAYNNYQNNQNAIYSRLGNLAQLGQASGTNTALGGSAFGQGIANTMVGAGNATAAGYTGVANAASGAAGNLSGYYLAQQYMNPNGVGNQTPAQASAYNNSFNSAWAGNPTSTLEQPPT